MSPGVALAPAAVVRMAAWPFEALEGLGDAALAARAALSDRDADPGLATAYDTVLAGERAVLHRRTSGDRRFLAALALANPALCRRALTSSPEAPRRKRVRHLETSLYRYLARAVGRTEPCGLWAGVALAALEAGSRFECRLAPRPPRHVVAPALAPFRALLRALGQRESYFQQGPWRINPTLARQPDGSWQFLVPTTRGPRRRELGAAPALDRILALLPALPAASLPQLAGALAAATGCAIPPLASSLAALVRGGALVGGLDLPVQFDSAWQALADSEAALHGADRELWRRTRQRLRTLAGELEERLDELPPAAICARMEQAATLLCELATGLALPCPELPTALLRCDLRLPHRVRFGPALRDAFHRALCAYQDHRTGTGTARLRAWQAARLRAFARDGVPLLAAPEAPLLRHGAAPSGTELAAVAADGAAAAPLGALLLRLGGRAGAHRLRLRGVMDEVAPVCARYLPLWQDAPADAAPLLDWLRTSLADLERESGCERLELLAGCEANPDALARPDLGQRRVDLWGAHPGAESLYGGRLVSRGDRLCLERPGRPPALVQSSSSADVAAADPVAALLLATSLRDAPAAEFLASSWSGDRAGDLELSAPVHLCDGSLARPRALRLGGAALAALLGARGAARYARWCRLVRDHALPPLVTVRRDAGPPLLVVASSPLAVECCLEGASATTILLIEAVDQPLAVPAADGTVQHHLVEIAVPFARPPDDRSTGDLAP